MEPRPRLTGLKSASVRNRLKFLRRELKVLRDPQAYSTDPVAYGQAYERIFSAFDIWGWEKTGGDENIKHNLGRIQQETLAQLYAEWQSRG